MTEIERDTFLSHQNQFTKVLQKGIAPNVGLEPTTVGLRVQRSTD